MEAIDRFPPAERDISSIIMSIPRSKLPQLKQEIIDFRRRIIEMVDGENNTADSFYSLMVELFPVGQTINNQGSDNEKAD